MFFSYAIYKSCFNWAYKPGNDPRKCIIFRDNTNKNITTVDGKKFCVKSEN